MRSASFFSSCPSRLRASWPHPRVDLSFRVFRPRLPGRPIRPGPLPHPCPVRDFFPPRWDRAPPSQAFFSMPQQIVIAEQLRIAAVLTDERVDELVVAQGRYQIGDVYLGQLDNASDERAVIRMAEACGLIRLWKDAA